MAVYRLAKQMLQRSLSFKHSGLRIHTKPKHLEEASFFTSEKGRKVSLVIFTLCGCAAVQTIFYGPHTWFIDQVFRIYVERGEKIQPHLVQLIEEVMQDLNQTEEDRAATKFALACSECIPEPKAYGDQSGKVLILIPKYFNYASEQDVAELSRFYCDEPKIKPVAEAQAWVNSMVLSNEAKKFAVTREIHRSAAGYYRQYGYVGFTCLFTTYLFSRANNVKFKLLQKSIRTRLLNYAFHATVFSLTCVMLCQSLKTSHNLELDDVVARSSLSLARGGAEFYAKSRDRNLAQKSFLPPAKADEINLNGEVKSTFFLSSPKLSDRIDACEKIVALHHAGLN